MLHFELETAFILKGSYNDLLTQINKAQEFNEKSKSLDNQQKIEISAKISLYFSANATRILKQENNENQELRKAIENNIALSSEILKVNKLAAEDIVDNCINQIVLTIKNNDENSKNKAYGKNSPNNILIDFVKSTAARSNNAKGKSFPVLTGTKRDFRILDNTIYRELCRRSERLKSTKDPIEIHKIFIESWEAVGLSLDATMRDTFKNITQKQYMIIASDGTFNLFLTAINLFKSKEVLGYALANGLISRDSALYFLQATVAAQSYK